MDSEIQFVDWVRVYIDRLVRVAHSFVRDRITAEDMVQEALLKAYKHRTQLHNEENPFPWLVKIVINECKSLRRKKWTEVIMSDVPSQLVMSTEEQVVRRSESAIIHNAILLLPEKYKTPIILFHFEELSLQQISSVLELNEQTIKTRLVRGRQRLRKMLVGEVRNDHGRDDQKGETFL